MHMQQIIFTLATHFLLVSLHFLSRPLFLRLSEFTLSLLFYFSLYTLATDMPIRCNILATKTYCKVLCIQSDARWH